MTTSVIVKVKDSERTPVVVMENLNGQTKNRVAHIISPGSEKEFTVHSHKNLNIMEVSQK